MAADGGFPSAYSSFAVSVDSRNAERPTYSTPSSDSSSGILRQTRPSSSAYSRDSSFHEKKRSLSPRSQDRLLFDDSDHARASNASSRSSKPGVRFTKDIIHEYQREPSALHHRRSSTAAFIEYIRTHLPESNNGTTLALTPKRGLILFAIVFSATYLALGLLPMIAGIAGFGSPVTVVIRRGDGYYGNSHIFRGGENLADPHLAGDEHHQYLAHAANAQQGSEAEGHSHSSNSKAKPKSLRTSTLAEEATLHEIRAARAKAKAEALARAQLLASQEEEDADIVEDHSDTRAVEEEHKAREDVRRRRPLMPLKKLAEKGKADRQAREKISPEQDGADVKVGPEVLQQKPFVGEAAALDRKVVQDKDSDDDDSELEGIIAKLRQEALDRRLSKIHRAQRAAKESHLDDELPRQLKNRLADNDEANIRRPGIVKSRKVSSKED